MNTFGLRERNRGEACFTGATVAGWMQNTVPLKIKYVTVRQIRIIQPWDMAESEKPQTQLCNKAGWKKTKTKHQAITKLNNQRRRGEASLFGVWMSSKTVVTRHDNRRWNTLLFIITTFFFSLKYCLLKTPVLFSVTSSCHLKCVGQKKKKKGKKKKKKNTLKIPVQDRQPSARKRDLPPPQSWLSLELRQHVCSDRPLISQMMRPPFTALVHNLTCVHSLLWNKCYVHNIMAAEVMTPSVRRIAPRAYKKKLMCFSASHQAHNQEQTNTHRPDGRLAPFHSGLMSFFPYTWL